MQQQLSPDRKFNVQAIVQSPEVVVSNASEGMHLPSRVRIERQAVKVSFFLFLYVGCQRKMWPRFRTVLPNANDLRLKLGLPTTTEKLAENPSQVFQGLVLLDAI